MSLNRDSTLAKPIQWLGNATSVAFTIWLICIFWLNWRVPELFVYREAYRGGGTAEVALVSSSVHFALWCFLYIVIDLLQKVWTPPGKVVAARSQRSIDILFSAMPIAFLILVMFQKVLGVWAFRQLDWDVFVLAAVTSVGGLLMFWVLQWVRDTATTSKATSKS